MSRRNRSAFQSLFCDFVQTPVFFREFNYPLCNLRTLYLLTGDGLHTQHHSAHNYSENMFVGTGNVKQELCSNKSSIFLSKIEII